MNKFLLASRTWDNFWNSVDEKLWLCSEWPDLTNMVDEEPARFIDPCWHSHFMGKFIILLGAWLHANSSACARTLQHFTNYGPRPIDGPVNR
jgi:hypothetical protein